MRHFLNEAEFRPEVSLPITMDSNHMLRSGNNKFPRHDDEERRLMKHVAGNRPTGGKPLGMYHWS